jgi:Rieske Fe-S protein
MSTENSRRAVIVGAGLAVGGALAGCSTKPVPYDANQAGNLPGSTPSAPMSTGTAPTSPAQAERTTATTTGKVLASERDIPVGGGVIFAAEKVVVTHPQGGKIRAFSAICTHVGCTVNQVVSGTIDCPCHGSQFKITDGSVVSGPAPSPLPKRKVKVEKGKVVLL